MKLSCWLVISSPIDSQLHIVWYFLLQKMKVLIISWNQILQTFALFYNSNVPSFFPNHISATLISKQHISAPDSIKNMEVGSDQSSVKKRSSIILGPWGGNGGASWDDGTYNGVREIRIVYDRCIDSICVVYDKSSKPVEAERHGGVGGTKMAEIKLQYPEEYLISVSGYYSPVVHGGSPVIRSLAFKSNQRMFGPYGVEEGTPFTFSIDGCQIVGFKGRSGWFLDSIGFRLSRVSTKFLQKVQKRLQRLTTTASNSSSTRNAEELVKT